MPNGSGKDQATRPQPNESENQPGFGPNDDPRRHDNSSPPPGGIDPDAKHADDEKQRVDPRKPGAR